VTLTEVAKVKASFIEPMLLLRKSELPEGAARLYEIKLDGYRAVAFETGGKLHLRSRNDNGFNARYPEIAKALAKMPDETVIDGEIVALDEDGKPSFNVLQNFGSSKGPLLYYVFDVMVLAGKDVMGETLDARRELLETKVLSKLGEPIRFSPELKASLPDLL
jgi:bifunctional non-homologous end joining protein LigD